MRFPVGPPYQTLTNMSKILFALCGLALIVAFSMPLNSTAASPSIAQGGVPEEPMPVDCWPDLMPDYPLDCGEPCYYGIGEKELEGCREYCENNWRACESAACQRKRDRDKASRADYLAKREKLSHELLDCLTSASTPAELDICEAAYVSGMTAATATLTTAYLASALVYLSDTAACDYDLYVCISTCCVPCDPWDGWPEDY